MSDDTLQRLADELDEMLKTEQVTSDRERDEMIDNLSNSEAYAVHRQRSMLHAHRASGMLSCIDAVDRMITERGRKLLEEVDNG